MSKHLLPSKTGLPEIANTRLANTVDFHIAATNFHSIIKTHIDFVTLSKYYNSLKYEADPITAEADFWEGLANANLDLQKFAKSPKAKKYLKRIEVNVPEGDTIKVDKGGNPIVFPDPKTGNLVLATVNGKFIDLTKDDSTNVNSQINEISNSFDISDKSGEFIFWWLDKYHKCHSKVKEILSERLTIEDTVLQQISESIGFLGYQHLLPQSRYLHYADDDADPVPIPYNSIIEDKLEPETRMSMMDLSKRTDAIFKRNMQQLFRSKEPSDASKAHRENLVTDHYHYERLKKNQNEINDNISIALGGAMRVLGWLQTNKLSNEQKIVPAVFQLIVEDHIEEVDILLNKVQTLQRPFDMGILS